ncbi:NMDA receptor synaptonuclear signaling and neuronal migration factor-like isoform X2 [Oscarella lobularis]|uniref:NMDA receptor synaptonuclear signaling and neuronal migration factor-like isoform X2 n=1 Tax=Oscarella lobularis TaxID=121494 RepID=UPI003313E20C
MAADDTKVEPIHFPSIAQSTALLHVPEERAAAAAAAVQADSESDKRFPTVCVARWGYGIVCTNKAELSLSPSIFPRGRVTSRGIPQLVKITEQRDWLTPSQAETQTPAQSSRSPRAATNYQAAVAIQRYIRDYEARKLQEREEELAQKDQRAREIRKWRCEKRLWQTESNKVEQLEASIGIKTLADIDDLQSEIDKANFAAEAQFEKTMLGDNTLPRIVLVASNVPNAEVLCRCVLKENLCLLYDFHEATPHVLTKKIRKALYDYKPGIKAKSLAIVCQGGPGYVYLLSGRVMTIPKLSKDPPLFKFWTGLGEVLSKINPDETCIHFINANIRGNVQGEKLLAYLENIIKPNIAHVKSLNELSPEGKATLEMYFNTPAYKTWKMKRHTKILF